jgi:molybdate transport system substrate-binding protein
LGNRIDVWLALTKNGGMSTCITGISSMATRLLLAELTALFQRQTGTVVAIDSTGGVDAAKRVLAGEPFDVVVLALDAIDKLIAAGCVLVGSRVAVVHSGVAVAVRAGAPHPDIGSEEAVRQAVLAARSLGYSTGPSGVMLARLFERWGIAELIAGRLVQAPPGVPVGTLVARGEVELGFQQLSELMHLEGIDVLGPLPPAIQITSTFCAGICATTAQAEAARALLDFLASPASADIKRRHGMEPA